MPELWKPLVGYEGLYEVSDHGNVRSLAREIEYKDGRVGQFKGQTLKLTQEGSGHLRVNLYRDGKLSKQYVHRLVLEAFRGPGLPGHECCHYDDDPANNHLSNLRWGTRSENRMDRVRNGGDHNTEKTECPQGHSYDGRNTYVSPSGRRQCRECARVRTRKLRARKKAAA